MRAPPPLSAAKRDRVPFFFLSPFFSAEIRGGDSNLLKAFHPLPPYLEAFSPFLEIATITVNATATGYHPSFFPPPSAQKDREKHPPLPSPQVQSNRRLSLSFFSIEAADALHLSLFPSRLTHSPVSSPSFPPCQATR